MILFLVILTALFSTNNATCSLHKDKAFVHTDLPSNIRKSAKPYLISDKSPIYPILNQLFQYRPTQDLDHLKAAGFTIIAKRPRSFIIVAKHESLPGYIFKLYLDTELRKKDAIPGWKWLTYRCRGQHKIAKVIKKNKIKRFVLPWKGLYPLPSQNAPKGAEFDSKPLILVAEEMPLIPKLENLRLWKEAITREHLDELYLILKKASSIRSRPDNLHFLPDGKIAIIDTEYPKDKPDFVSIIPYLNDEMAAYWRKLIK